MGISQNMTGSPWHVERMHRSEGEDRRHRHKCIYYDAKTGQCSKLLIKCFGSAHCISYREEVPDSLSSSTETELPKKVKTTHRKRIIVDSRDKVCDPSHTEFQLGDEVSHKRFGVGTIVKFLPDGIVVRFSVGTRKIYMVPLTGGSYQARDCALKLVKSAKPKGKSK